jgi:hypothetical protein
MADRGGDRRWDLPEKQPQDGEKSGPLKKYSFENKHLAGFNRQRLVGHRLAGNDALRM